MVILFFAKILVLKYRAHESLYFRFFILENRGRRQVAGSKGFRSPAEVQDLRHPHLKEHARRVWGKDWLLSLERHYAVNAVCAEDAEFALVITAKVDEAATALSGAG